MTADAYTKAVLTVIAACLVWMCLNRITPAASAQAGQAPPTPVVFVDVNGVPLYSPDGLRVNIGKAVVPVEVSTRSLPLPVSLRSIQRTAAWDPLQVQVMREPPTLKPVP